MPQKPIKRVEFAATANGAGTPIDVLVATRLRNLRTEKKLTLQDLSSRTGIAASFLSRVENHKASPPLAGLEKLANALDIEVEAFFRKDAEPQLLVHTERSRRRVMKSAERPGYLYEMLAQLMPGKLMEPFVLKLTPNTPRTSPGTHVGEEFIFALKGESTLLYGKHEYGLKPGDAAYYNASVPHASYAVGKTECELLVVISSREYLYHGDLQRLLGRLKDGKDIRPINL